VRLTPSRIMGISASLLKETIPRKAVFIPSSIFHPPVPPANREAEADLRILERETPSSIVTCVSCPASRLQMAFSLM
jgi:hypothetical protein